MNVRELFQVSPLFEINREYAEKYRVLPNQGGTSSGKTYSILQLLTYYAITAKRHKKKVITVVGQDIPNLKAGALRDMAEIAANPGVARCLAKPFNHTDRIYTFTSGFIMEFKSYEDEQDAKSGKRDFLFINEANGERLEVYNQLALRTEFNCFLDFNADCPFWVHSDLVGQEDVKLIISDHTHNPFLSLETHNKIEAIKDYEYWKVYARGATGKREGAIFKYDVIEKVPEGARLIGTGLDFGFTNDPTAIVDIYLYEGKLIWDERLYRRGLHNVQGIETTHEVPNISEELKKCGYVKRESLIICDSAAPGSIAELESAGWRMKPANKYAGSVRDSIGILNRYEHKVTARSKNLKIEMDSYRWAVTKEGIQLNEPIDKLNHLIDGGRYVALEKLNSGKSRETYKGYFSDD